MRKESFDMRFKLITRHKNKEHAFNSDLFRNLMKSC